jgi:tRNA A37 threonylcarbamoyladenosine dehydratase
MQVAHAVTTYLTLIRSHVVITWQRSSGGRLDASRVRVVPMSCTHNDPFAAYLRKTLRRRGVDVSQVSPYVLCKHYSRPSHVACVFWYLVANRFTLTQISSENSPNNGS